MSASLIAFAGRAGATGLLGAGGLFASPEGIGNSRIAAAPSPSPAGGSLRPDLAPTDVSPGLGGFLAIFAVALVAIGLFYAMTRQLRRMGRNAAELGLPVPPPRTAAIAIGAAPVDQRAHGAGPAELGAAGTAPDHVGAAGAADDAGAPPTAS